MPNIRQIINLLASRDITLSIKTVDNFASMINNCKHFSFSRFGDGEWNAILGEKGANCDGHEYTNSLRDGLVKALVNQKKYLYGIQPFALKNLGFKIKKFIKNNKLSINWYNASVLHDANINSKLNPFVKALRNKKCVIIGPKYLSNLTLFPIYEHITIPTKNCFDAKDNIKKRISTITESNTNVVYLFSASMATNVIIDELYDSEGKDNWLLDVGALWDIYVNVKSRAVYETINWQQIIKENSK